jgi:hypothetical protein
MGISEKQYQAMLKSNDQVAVISDPGKVTIDYGQVQRQGITVLRLASVLLHLPKIQ